jgi:hypothetical protein
VKEQVQDLGQNYSVSSGDAKEPESEDKKSYGEDHPVNQSHIDSEIAGIAYDGCLDAEQSYLQSDLDNGEMLALAD